MSKEQLSSSSSKSISPQQRKECSIYAQKEYSKIWLLTFMDLLPAVTLHHCIKHGSVINITFDMYVCVTKYLVYKKKKKPHFTWNSGYFHTDI